MPRPLVLLIALVAMLVPATALAQTAKQPTNDPYVKNQWGVKDVGAPAAWTKTKGNGITIAVVDSGVDVDHPDLKGKLVPGYDFGDMDNNPDDDSRQEDGNGVVVQGHGTHVAGLATAITDNGVGVAGVAPDAKLMPLKVFPSSPNAGLVAVLTAVPKAIRYAVDHGARVINLSVGGITGLSLVGHIETPCAEAYRRGALCVVAAGNTGENNQSGYQSDAEFLIVTAHDVHGVHAGFGQKADTQWAVSAPGVDNFSTYPVELGSYTSLQGTSMAAPHAAGVAALLFALKYSVGQVLDRILTTATPMGDPGTNGAGRINAAAAAGVVPAATTATTRPVLGRSPTTRRSNAFGSSQGNSGGSSTKTTVTLADANTDDDFGFAAGPAAANKLRPATQAEPVKQVSAATMLITLGVIGVLGLGWGLASSSRRRGKNIAPGTPAPKT